MASPNDSSSSTSTDGYFERNNRIMLAIAREATRLIFYDDEETSSRQMRRPAKNRNRLAGHELLLCDYFSDNPVYEEDFRRRFRMSRRLFERIVHDLEGEYQFFKWAWDARGRKGFSPLQKCTSAIRQLAYESPANSNDEHLRMSDKTSRNCLHNFCKGIVHLYKIKYLRKPTYDDVQTLYVAHEAQHGFLGMLGSIDCKHWAWSNCPVAWRGQYMRGDHERPTVMLEAVASHDLWIWHAFFEVVGSNNDINVLTQSPIFNDLYEDKAPDCPFEVNGVHYKHGYYLADGIYPEWATFVKSCTCPQDNKRKKFKFAQKSARKDIERAFGVLKQRWFVIGNPARAWSPAKLRNIMYACIILHNMILEDEGNAICSFDENNLVADDIETHISEEQRAAKVRQVKNRETHNNLQSDLVKHIWSIQVLDNEDN